jgi:hypothetical protein
MSGLQINCFFQNFIYNFVIRLRKRGESFIYVFYGTKLLKI